ncbi:hypothetical protein U9M48_035291 [Paspalum notatum var. saurae]|uniref:DDE Tnp4 domain-containing protein n=1 Tax=Paspalum notatum var. saurae TaxID=547442 RepID=A0AAQ3UEW2_PASNO
MQEHVKKIADSADAIATKRLGEVTIKQVMDLVVACGATFGTNEHFIATKLFVKREQREMFMILDTLSEDSSGTDSEEEDMEFIRMVLSGAQITTEYIGTYIDKNPPRTSTLSGMGWLKETLHTPGECHSQLRMSTEVFMDLHDLLVRKYGLRASLHMSAYESLAIFLFICGGNESNRRSQNRFKHSGETISRKYDEVLNAIMAMAKDFIRPKNPNFPDVHSRIRDHRKAYPHFKDCISALDGTHIHVCLSPDDQIRFIGKSGIPTQNVLAVCDFDMRFTYVSTGQPGAMHDTSVLYSAIQVDDKFFPHPPRGKYYVVDAGYPNRLGYLAPYKGERYHVPEWHRGMESKTPKEKFNRVHSSIRNVIDRCFGLLKMKWQILYNMPSYSMTKHKRIVVATMVVHNFIRKHRTEDLDFARFDRDLDFVPTIPERYNKFATVADGSTTMQNAPTMDAFRNELATALAVAWN